MPVSDPYLEFDGCNLNYIDENGNVAKSWKAYSGGRGTTRENQRERNRGPIPEGIYRVSPSETQEAIWFLFPSLEVPYPLGVSIGVLTPVYRPWANTPSERDSWGDYRTPIVPVSGDTYGRSGFYIHGGARPGSAGCIDLVSGNNDFHKWFKQNGRDLSLNVKYTCNPWR